MNRYRKFAWVQLGCLVVAIIAAMLGHLRVANIWLAVIVINYVTWDRRLK